MSTVSTISLSLLLLTLLLCAGGCAPSSGAPRNWLPDNDDLVTEPYGAWMRVTTWETARTKREDRMGEFIAVDSTTLYLLDSSAIVAIPLDSITLARLYAHRNSRASIAGWTVAGTLSSLTHGLLSIVTLPAWVITGTIMTSHASYDGQTWRKRPGRAWWRRVALYARFPAGLPEGFDATMLLAKPVP